MIRPGDVVPLTEFHRNSAAFMRRLKKDGRPIVLTVNGRAAAVVTAPQAFERYSAAMEAAELEDSLVRAIAEVDAGLGRPAEEVFEELEAKYFTKSGRPRRRRSA